MKAMALVMLVANAFFVGFEAGREGRCEWMNVVACIVLVIVLLAMRDAR